ncbi:MAG: hypothetical protein LBH76_04670, partial [Propionibacteriaceae bacterium]|nr:hypothetical protein [Propionibacteriaceae bacterium]
MTRLGPARAPGEPEERLPQALTEIPFLAGDTPRPAPAAEEPAAPRSYPTTTARARQHGVKPTYPVTAPAAPPAGRSNAPADARGDEPSHAPAFGLSPVAARLAAFARMPAADALDANGALGRHAAPPGAPASAAGPAAPAPPAEPAQSALFGLTSDLTAPLDTAQAASTAETAALAGDAAPPPGASADPAGSARARSGPADAAGRSDAAAADAADPISLRPGPPPLEPVALHDSEWDDFMADAEAEADGGSRPDRPPPVGGRLTTRAAAGARRVGPPPGGGRRAPVYPVRLNADLDTAGPANGLSPEAFAPPSADDDWEGMLSPDAGATSYTRHTVVRLRDEVAGQLAEVPGFEAMPETERHEVARRSIRAAVVDHIGRMMLDGELSWTAATQREVAQDVFNMLFKLGRIQPLVDDPTVEDIHIHGSTTWLRRSGQALEPG